MVFQIPRPQDDPLLLLFQLIADLEYIFRGKLTVLISRNDACHFRTVSGYVLYAGLYGCSLAKPVAMMEHRTASFSNLT